MRRVSPLLLPLALAACVRPSEPPPPPPEPPRTAPVPAVPLPPPAAADWRDWSATPGTWAWSRTGSGSRASFGAAGLPARAAFTCSGGQVRFALGDARPGTLTIRTSSTSRTVAAVADAAVPGGAVATFAAGDPLLDAMAFSRGRFAVERPGAPPVVLPAWAEIGRVIEDCRG